MFFLIYFDRIMLSPINMNFGMGGGFQSSTLLEQTLVRRDLAQLAYPPAIRQDGDWDAQLLADVIAPTFEGLRTFEGGHWALAGPPEVEPLFEGDALTSLVMTLRRTLPCPRPDRPLDELLAFKQAHIEELRRFRHGISKLSLMFRSGSDPIKSLTVAHTEIESIVDDVRRAFEGDKIPFFTPDLSISWAIPSVAVAALAEIISQELGLPPGLGEVVASGITFNVGRSRLAHEGNSAPRDFSYLLSGMNESLLEAFPQRGPLIFDIENVVVRNNIVRCFYPPELRSPPSLRGSIFTDNYSM